MTLEDAIVSLYETGAVPEFADAVRKGQLTKDFTTPSLETAFPGQPKAQMAAAVILREWKCELSDTLASGISRMIECGAKLLARERQLVGEARLVWTGPQAPGSYLRSNRQIVREMIMGARHEVWLVAYWIAGPRDGEGIVSDVIDLLAQAKQKGLDVALALDGRQRANGESNFDVIRCLWPREAKPPRLYTWADALLHPHLKLHAKALVTDRMDALVTSANLTMHALEHSMELGVRIKGVLATEIANQLECLVGSKILSPVEL